MAVKKLEEIKKVVDCSSYEVGGDFALIDFKDRQMVGISVKKYEEIREKFEELLKMEFNLELEREIIPEFPIDIEDVKAVVREEMKRDPHKPVSDIVKKVRTQHPNLFMDLDSLFKED